MEGSAPAPRARVLVVDDEESIRGLIGLALRDIADVSGVSTGEEGLRRATEQPPDLIILDARLPDGSGLEVARRLRDAAATRATPILMISGDSLTAEQSAAARIDGCLRKPFDVEELRAAVGRHIARA